MVGVAFETGTRRGHLLPPQAGFLPGAGRSCPGSGGPAGRGYRAPPPRAAMPADPPRPPAAPRPVGRLAPSPTGRLHLGHARSFLLAWWSVRQRGGRMLLRIEDLDAGRARPELADLARRDLEWLGLDWDGPVLVQSADRAP